MLHLAQGSTVSPWAWHPHPEIWLGLFLLAAGYAWAVNVLGPRFVEAGKRPASPKQIFSFYLGLAILWLSADWPLHDLGERYLFSAHMVQHLAFMLIVPPLLLVGMPRWLLRKLVSPRPVFAAMRVATKPIVALVVFNIMVAFIHWPVIVELQTSSLLGHGSIHLLILGSSLMMWWPVISPLPELGRMSDLAKMFYLFLTSILPTIPASFLTFARDVLYTHYESVPRVFGITPETDQMIAGLIMKIGGGLLLWTVIAILFFQWFAREERDQVDEVSWDDFERELEVRNMRK